MKNEFWPDGDITKDLKVVANKLGVSTQTVRGYVHHGQLRVVRVNGGKMMFTWGAVQEFLKAQEQTLTPPNGADLAA